MKKRLLLALAVFSIGSAQAHETDAAVVFGKTLKAFDRDFFPTQNCDSVLQKSWGKFSGNTGRYSDLAKQYMNGATLAAICGTRRGYLTYLWLGEVEKLKKSGAIKKNGVDAALNQATKNFMKIPLNEMNEFLESVSCNAQTPHIQAGNTFTQVVTLDCETIRGPAKVDPQSLYITVGGKDIWNGPRGDYLGRSLTKALGIQ